MDALAAAWGALAAALGAVPGPAAGYALAVVFFGYVVLGVSGFGSALLIVPLLAQQWPLFTVVPLVLLLDLQSTLQLTRLNIAHVDGAELRSLLPGMAVGAAVGVGLARWSAHPAVLALLGLYVLAVAGRGLRRDAHSGAGGPASRRWAPLFGAAAGVIESVFGTSGPVVVAWLARRRPESAAMRANVPAALAAVTCLALAGMAVSGQLFQPLVWASLLPLAAVAFAGTLAGHAIAGRLPHAMVTRIIFALLACAGAAMVLRATLWAGA